MTVGSSFNDVQDERTGGRPVQDERKPQNPPIPVQSNPLILNIVEGWADGHKRRPPPYPGSNCCCALLLAMMPGQA